MLATLLLVACAGDERPAGGAGIGAGDGGGDGASTGSSAAAGDGGGGARDAGGANDAATAGGAGGDAATGSDAGSGAEPPPSMGCQQSPWNEGDFAQVFDVGPGHALATPSDVPWESVGAGTLVRIHARPSPYLDKWVINVAGTQAEPMVVRGVPDASGALPQIRGNGAITRAGIDFWGEERAIIKIGGSNTPSNLEPSHVFVECLDIAGARAGNVYTGDDGAQHEYAGNAAAITVESGDHVTLRGNLLHDCGNGLFAASQSSDLKVIGNHVFDNGNAGSIYEHNSYTESLGILFEGNHYGPLCDGCLGNNLKDRSAGTVVRYNWIESGNRQLDLVDSDHAELSGDPSYTAAFVYGNVLVEPDGAGNSQVLHYGGDSGATATYRKGTLHFFHNTVVSTRSGNTTLARLSSADETMDARNNVLYVVAAGTSLAISGGDGSVALRHNWLKTGFRATHGSLTGSVTDVTGNLTGADPGFADAAAQDFSLGPSSPCSGAGGPLAPEAAAHPPLQQIDTPTALVPRPTNALVDIGAFGDGLR